MIVCSYCDEKYDRDPVDGRCVLCRHPTTLMPDEMKSKNMTTEFFMPMIPPTATHQEKQVTCKSGTPVFYEPDDVKAARAKLTAHLGQHVPDKKYKGALRVMVKWMFPIPEGSKHYDGEWKITKPDTHNLNKLPFDIMTDLGYWTDDAIVASEIIEKFWAKLPGIYVRIEEL